MEKTMTRRIIGVLVVFALVIIMLPLLFNTNVAQSPLQTSEIKAPPFPDQQNANMNSAAVALAAKSSIPPSKTGEMIKKAMTSADVAANKPAPVVTPLKVNLQPAMQEAAAAIAAKMNEKNNAKPVIAVASVAKTPKKFVSAPNAMESDAHASLVPAPGTDVLVIGQGGEVTQLTEANMRDDLNQLDATKADLTKLKKTAWVIQLGSFKDKHNAERLTNSLRAKGYKAFTFETKSNGQTRVYVGPEAKQVAASTLASKIEQDTNMRGIVLTFKPIEL
ncbi:MAG: SPOR domain-containing protein [Gammaproteobacteria bacterium]|nr:SPOR domain-containing protein [Gammaproteobacteria bacterium]